MLPPEVSWYGVAFGLGVGGYVAKRLLMNAVDDFYDFAAPRMWWGATSSVEAARIQWQRWNSDTDANDLIQAVREDDRFEEGSEQSEEEELAEFQDSLGKAKRALRDSSFDTNVLQ